MATSTDINLPRSHIAQFPNKCVVCDAESPDSTLRHFTGTLGWWTWIFFWFGSVFSVTAPACKGCGWKHHGRRILSLLLTAAIGFLALTYIWPHLKDEVPRSLHRWAGVALCLVCILPQILWEVFFAAPFNITAYSESVDYEFGSMDLAAEFAVENMDADWVKINGTDFRLDD